MKENKGTLISHFTKEREVRMSQFGELRSGSLIGSLRSIEKQSIEVKQAEMERRKNRGNGMPWSQMIDFKLTNQEIGV